MARKSNLKFEISFNLISGSRKFVTVKSPLNTPASGLTEKSFKENSIELRFLLLPFEKCPVNIRFSNLLSVDVFSTKAGDVAMLIGGEYRFESYSDDRDPLLDGTVPFANYQGLTHPFVSAVIGSSPSTDTFGERNVDSYINLIIKEPYLDISIAGEPEIMKNILNAEPLYWKTLRKFKAGNPSSFNMYYPESIKYAWWIQDLSASIPAKLLLNQSISEIIDVCSSPGGKSAQLAASGKNITCLDINPLRIKLLEQNINRLGLKTKNIVCDATKWTPQRSPDAILIDAPCSSTGTIRRNPDILINITKNKIIELVEIQKKLIDNSISWLKKGGIIVYCVCSLQKEEGEDQIIALLKRNKNIDILPIKPDEAKIFEKSITKEGWLRILPNSLKSFDGSDGFFICKLICK